MLDWKEFVERAECGGAYLAGGSGRHPPADELCQPRSLPPDRPAACPPQPLGRRAGSPRGDRACTEIRRNGRGCERLARTGGRATVEQHVGYYLVDRGRAALEAGIGYRPTWHAALGRFAGRAPLASYLGAILLVWLLTVIAAAALGVRLEMVRIAGPAAALLLLALFAGAAGQFAVSLVNWLCTLLVPPRPMMRLDFSAGIPAEHRTLVAVPALLTSERTVRDLVEQLELRYLANQDDNLWFALLSDFPDADQETLAGDQRLLELARTEIERLNERYCADRPGIFYLLHRPRKWNRQQGAWMGEERKRGKLAALNRLLRTGAADAFSATIGDLPQLRSVRYVITLDSDTRLPRDAGRELVGCAAHPLNQARNRSAFAHGGCGLRRASAAGNRHHARGASQPLQPPGGGRCGNRSLYAPDQRSLSRPVWARQFHRQRDLRRGGVRVGLRRPFSRKPPVEPRPDRRLLRPQRPGQRRGTVRRSSLAAAGRYEPPPPLDTRRLADCFLVGRSSSHAAGKRRPIHSPGCRGGKSWTTCGAASRRCCC